MTLYFDSVIQSPSSHAINTHMAWHSQASCLAVASYNEEKGGIVNVYTGEVFFVVNVSRLKYLFLPNYIIDIGNLTSVLLINIFH